MIRATHLPQAVAALLVAHRLPHRLPKAPGNELQAQGSRGTAGIDARGRPDLAGATNRLPPSQIGTASITTARCGGQHSKNRRADGRDRRPKNLKRTFVGGRDHPIGDVKQTGVTRDTNSPPIPNRPVTTMAVTAGA